MNEAVLLDLLSHVAQGKVNPEEALTQLKIAPAREGCEVNLDSHRALRTGFGEIIYAASKSDEQLEAIANQLRDTTEPCLFSRTSVQQADLLGRLLPNLHYDPKSRLAGINKPKAEYQGLVVVAAGSSDVPVAEEAALTAEYMAVEVRRLYDVGVAGIHRLLSHSALLSEAKAVVAVAGMEGALASVITGLVSCPVFAVPTSVGYGASFGGVAALLAMLNSCATGMSVLNIDNGLGAGYCGAMVVRRSR